jgi:hypothetical protein
VIPSPNVPLTGRIMEVVLFDGDATLNVPLASTILLFVVLLDGDADITIFSKVFVSIP